jgi:hypothetical protein
VSEDLDRRNRLTFAQAEGASPVPSQLALKEISEPLRARLWRMVYSQLVDSFLEQGAYFGDVLLADPWKSVMLDWFTDREHGYADEFNNKADKQIAKAKRIITEGGYVAVFDFLQFVMRHHKISGLFAKRVGAILQECQAAYRVVDRTIIPIASAEEGMAIEDTLRNLQSIEFGGCRAHLVHAGTLLTAGKHADSVRESIHAVEAIARFLEPSANTLGPALQKLEKMGRINPNLRRGFSALYDYTSDEQGVRHSLVEKDAASVSEAEAVYMFGASAAFVGYLIRSMTAPRR